MNRSDSNHYPMLSSHLIRKYEEDDDISGREAMLRRRKLPKTTNTFEPPSSTPLKMTWTKHDEILILSGIVDYQKETESSYTQTWDDFYDYMRVTMKSDFSKKQLMDKVKKLKKRFRDNQARVNDGKSLSFSNKDDRELFTLSKIIWAEKETDFAYEENKDQTKCLVLKEDVPCAEHEWVVTNANTEIDNGENEKSEEDGVDDLCVIEDALEAATSFHSLSENLRKFLLGNLMKIVGANQRKELTDEWKALLTEDMQLDIEKRQLDIKKRQLDIKKQTFSAKLVNLGFSA